MNVGRAVCIVWALGIVLLGFAMFPCAPSVRQKYHDGGGPVAETVIVLFGTLWLVAIFSSKRKTVDASASATRTGKARWMVTLLVLGITVGSILLISNVRKVRDLNTCLNNMRHITAGIWATGLAKGVSNGAVVPVEEVVPYLKNGLPKCPSGGRYTIPVMGDEARCSMHGALKDFEKAQNASTP